MRMAAMLAVGMLGCQGAEGSGAPLAPAATPEAPPAKATTPATDGVRVLASLDAPIVALVADDHAVYYAMVDGDLAGQRDDSIWRVGVDGGATTRVATPGGIVTAMALDHDGLLVATTTNARSDSDPHAALVRISIADGEASTLAHVGARALAGGTTHVFFRDSDAIGRIARDGGPIEIIRTARHGRSLVAVGDDVYFDELDRRTGTLFRVRAGAAAPEAVIRGPGCCSDVRARDGAIYVEVLEGLFELGPQGPRAITDMPEPDGSSAHGAIAVSAAALSWITAQGTVWTAPRQGGSAAARCDGPGLAGDRSPTVASNRGALFVAYQGKLCGFDAAPGTTQLLRIDDRATPATATGPVEWVTVARLDLGDTSSSLEEQVNRKLGDFHAAIERGEIAVRILGRGAAIEEQVRRLATAAGTRARITADVRSALPPGWPPGRVAISLSAREVERFFTPSAP